MSSVRLSALPFGADRRFVTQRSCSFSAPVRAREGRRRPATPQTSNCHFWCRRRFARLGAPC
eukprot:11997286-Alexandrium_andersonii.AAC.1